MFVCGEVVELEGWWERWVRCEGGSKKKVVGGVGEEGGGGMGWETVSDLQ